MYNTFTEKSFQFITNAMERKHYATYEELRVDYIFLPEDRATLGKSRREVLDYALLEGVESLDENYNLNCINCKDCYNCEGCEDYENRRNKGRFYLKDIHGIELTN